MAIQTFTTGQVLTAAQVNSLNSNDFNQTVSAKTASYTLVAADKGTRITMSSTSATTVTVNSSLFAAGDTLFIQNANTGVCTITAGTATVSTSASLALAQHEGGTLFFTSAGVSTFFKSAGATPASGGITLINTGGTALSGTSTTISSIPSSFQTLLVIVKNVSVNTASGTGFRVNSDTGNNYYKSGTAESEWFNLGSATSTNTVAENNYGQLELPQYATAGTQLGFFRGFDNFNNQNVTNTLWYDKAATISSITFKADGSATFQGGKIFVFGVS